MLVVKTSRLLYPDLIIFWGTVEHPCHSYSPMNDWCIIRPKIWNNFFQLTYSNSLSCITMACGVLRILFQWLHIRRYVSLMRYVGMYLVMSLSIFESLARHIMLALFYS